MEEKSYRITYFDDSKEKVEMLQGDSFEQVISQAYVTKHELNHGSGSKFRIISVEEMLKL